MLSVTLAKYLCCYHKPHLFLLPGKQNFGDVPNLMFRFDSPSPILSAERHTGKLYYKPMADLQDSPYEKASTLPGRGEGGLWGQHTILPHFPKNCMKLRTFPVSPDSPMQAFWSLVNDTKVNNENGTPLTFSYTSSDRNQTIFLKSFVQILWTTVVFT